MKIVVAGALGECVHVAGVINFLRLAESAGWQTVFLGPATSIHNFIQTVHDLIMKHGDQPDELLVGVSYRLTPETGERLLGEFAEAADGLHASGVRFAFAGTPPLAARAAKMGFFERTFQGGEPAEITLAYLKGQPSEQPSEADIPQKTVDRIRWKAPYPLLRHHFGLPTMQATREGIQVITESQALDVISLGIDQDAQENFFHPERQDPRRKGAGGVPVRTPDDYRALYQATRHGNFPLVRTYSGTDDFLKLAAMYVDTIHIAWCAIPLFWFNQMDGRGPWNLAGSIREHQQVMAWYGQHGIPVELNEPHHWGMRDAPDVIFVVSAYLAAYNAKACGVQDYIAQLMFNSPPGLSDAMDLAKMLAVLEKIQPLESPTFRIWRQTRTGLLSYPLDPAAARAHLAASIYLQMALRPHIIHIVGHSEADHAATAEEVIEAASMARRSIQNALSGQPDMTQDAAIQQRKQELLAQATLTLQAIRKLGEINRAEHSIQSQTIPWNAETLAGEIKLDWSELWSDPLTNPAVLAAAVQIGILDAPHLRGNSFAKGIIKTRIINGACQAVDASGQPLNEALRLNNLSKGMTS